MPRPAIHIDDSAGIVIPNPGGQEAFAGDWTHGVVAAEGGWFSGKSFIGARKLLTLHMRNARDDDYEPTEVQSAAVAPTYGNALDFCVPHLQDAIEDAGLSWRWHGPGWIANGRWSGPALILPDLGTIKKPSIIMIRSADTPKSITGWQVGALWGDEPARWPEDKDDPKNDALTQITGRVRDPKSWLNQIMLTYTNEGDTTAIYEFMHQNNQDRALYRIPTSENPHADEFRHMQARALTPELAEQYLEGKAQRMRGNAVYPNFDKDLHVTKAVKLVTELPLHLALDFNIEPGMHGIVGQYFENDDMLTAVYEFHGGRWATDRLMDEFIQWINDSGGWRWPELHIYGDPSGRAHWSGIGQSNYFIVQKKLQAADIPYRTRVTKAAPPVADRINAVNLALLDTEQEVHYKIHRRCERLIEDFDKLHRDKLGEIDKGDRKLSHSSDADGYRICYLRPARVKMPELKGRHSVTVVR